MHDRLDPVDRERLAHHFFRQDGGFGDMDVRADDVAGVDVDHDVGVVVDALGRTGQHKVLSQVNTCPGPVAIRSGRARAG